MKAKRQRSIFPSKCIEKCYAVTRTTCDPGYECERPQLAPSRDRRVWPYDVIPLYRAPRSVWTRHRLRIKVIAGPPIVVAHSRVWGTEEDRSYAV